MHAILVTGGAGFIGSHVCDALIGAGMSVRCFDSFITGQEANIDHLIGSSGFELVRGDIRDQASVMHAVRGMDAVVHLAALGSVPRSIADPLASEAANLQGFLHVLEAWRAEGRGGRLVYASSSSVYGDSTASPKREGQEGRPLSPYAVTKAMDEVYAALYHRLYGVRSIGLRFFNVFGERQDPEGPYAAAIPRFIRALMRHDRPEIYGDGSQTRDFTYVGNAVRAVLLALSTTDPRAEGAVCNVAVGDSIALNDLLGLIRERVAAIDPTVGGIQPVHRPDRPGDVRHSLADIGRAADLIGYAPAMDVAAGLDRTVPWYVRHGA
jgi:UDP-N-acetylglucosamine 4-epimerase